MTRPSKSTDRPLMSRADDLDDAAIRRALQAFEAGVTREGIRRRFGHELRAIKAVAQRRGMLEEQTP